MNFSFFRKVTFDVAWKICLLAVLIWIALELREIGSSISTTGLESALDNIASAVADFRSSR